MLKIYALHNDGTLILDDAGRLKGTPGLLWMHCVRPSEEDLRLIERATNIPHDHLSAALEEEIHPYVHPYVDKAGHVELAYRAPLIEDGDVVTEPLSIFFKGRYVVTISTDQIPVIEEIAQSLAQNKSKFLLRGRPPEFTHYLLDRINDEFFKRLERITTTIDKVEASPGNLKNFELLYGASLTSAHFNHAVVANIEVLNTLRKFYHKTITDEDREKFGGLYLDALQVLDTEKIQRELIANLFMFENVMANQKVERKLRRITVLAILIAVPTLISGLYGMNIALPFQNNPFAFWIVLAIMAAASAGLLVMFKMLDWA